VSLYSTFYLTSIFHVEFTMGLVYSRLLITGSCNEDHPFHWLAYSHHCFKSKANSSYVVITRKQFAEFLQPGSHLSVTGKPVSFFYSSADGQCMCQRWFSGSFNDVCVTAREESVLMTAWNCFNICNAGSQRPHCHISITCPLIFIYMFATSDYLCTFTSLLYIQ